MSTKFTSQRDFSTRRLGRNDRREWIPACAGMTLGVGVMGKVETIKEVGK